MLAIVEAVDLHAPVPFGCGNLLGGTRAFQEQGGARGTEQAVRVAKQRCKRSKGTGSDQWRRRKAEFLDSGTVDLHRGASDPLGLDEEGGFAPIRLNEAEGNTRRQCEDEAGEAGARSEVDTAGSALRNEWKKAQAVQYMARPYDPMVPLRDKVY